MTSSVDLNRVVEAAWGPSLVEGGKWFILQGRRRVIPPDVRDAAKFVENLRIFDRFQLSYSTPAQREEFVQRKLAVLAKELPVNGVLLVYAVASTVIICCATVCAIKANL